jgi:hypothetical protein
MKTFSETSLGKEFFIKSVNLFGVDSFLIYPKFINPIWNETNKIYRSSIWRAADFKPLSLGYKKFENLGSNPNFEPIDFKRPIEYIRKIDGSLGIISKINGNICFRTRQTTDARLLLNGHEIDLLIHKYPKIFNNDYINSENFTILVEWTTPNNVICLKESREPELWLTGLVQHSDYSYLPQNELDRLAKEWGINRPERYTFENFDKAILFSKENTEIEGFVLYCNDGQVLKKCKSELYLKMHRFKENANIETVLELFVENGCPSYQDFSGLIEKQYDYECLQMVRPFISDVCDAYKEVKMIISGFDKTIQGLRSLSTRKLVAEAVLSKYGNTNRASFVFKMFDSKELSKDDVKKLLWQVLKK